MIEQVLVTEYTRVGHRGDPRGFSAIVTMLDGLARVQLVPMCLQIVAHLRNYTGPVFQVCRTHLKHRTVLLT